MVNTFNKIKKFFKSRGIEDNLNNNNVFYITTQVTTIFVKVDKFGDTPMIVMFCNLVFEPSITELLQKVLLQVNSELFCDVGITEEGNVILKYTLFDGNQITEEEFLYALDSFAAIGIIHSKEIIKHFGGINKIIEFK